MTASPLIALTGDQSLMAEVTVKPLWLTVILYWYFLPLSNVIPAASGML